MNQNSRQLLVSYPFLTCFLIGAVFIVLLRLIFSGTGGAILAVLVATAAIGLLGWYYYRSGVKDLLRAGDELYYLGLLFTLVSLSYALVSLFIINPNAVDLEQRTNDLIGSFGIALGSTIVGILARILLQGLEDSVQIPPPPEDKKTILTNLDTTEDLLFLRLQLREAGDAFSHFTRMTLNQAEQTAVHSEQLIEEFNARMNSNLESELDKTVTSWRDVIRETGEQSQKVISDFAQLTQDTFERTGKNWQTLSEKAQTTSLDIQTQLKTSSTILSKMLEHIHTANHSLNNLASSLKITAQEVAMLGNTVTDVTTRLNSSSTEIVDGYEAFKQGTQHHMEQFNARGEDVQGSMSILLDSINSINHSLTAIASNLETAEQHTGNIRDNAANTALELSEHTEHIVNTYEEIRKGAQEQGEVQRHISEMRGLIESLAVHISKLNSSIEQQKIHPFRFWKN